MIRVCILAVLTAGCTSNYFSVGEFPPSALSTLTDAVVALEGDSPGSVKCAGAFLPDGRLVTAAHCVDHAIERAASFDAYHSSPRAWQPFECQHLDRQRDVAVLAPLASWPMYHGAIPLGRSPGYGDPVAIIGHPSGLEWSVSTGRVSYPRRRYGGGTWTQITAPTWFGNSGGPAISADGHLIGVVSHIRSYQAHLAFAAHRDAIEEALASPMDCGLPR